MNPQVVALALASPPSIKLYAESNINKEEASDNLIIRWKQVAAVSSVYILEITKDERKLSSSSAGTVSLSVQSSFY